MRGPRYLSLNIKLALAIVPLMLVFMAFNFGIILQHEKEILREETEKRALSLATGLAIVSSESFRTLTLYLLQPNVDKFSTLQDVEAALIIDAQGRLVAHKGNPEPDPDPRRQANLEEEVQRLTDAALQGQEQTRMDERRGVLDVWKPIRVDNQTHGAVRITLSLRGMIMAVDSSRRNLEGLTLILLAGSVVFIGVLARWFTQPMLTLARVARDLARGQLETRALNRQNDEVGILGMALNHMAMRLEHMIDREKEAREKLQHRVTTLRSFTARVIEEGYTTAEAPPGEPDEMGQLTKDVNDVVRHMRVLLEEERAMRETVETQRHELELANEKLQELDQLKSEFLNTVSHELRTPLTSIKAFAEILLDNEGEDLETQMEFLGIINKESDRLTRLINNLLDLSRIEAGRMNWDFDNINLQEVTQVACTSLKVAADKKGVIFDVDAPEPLPTVGDYDKMVQVITNLVGNALKFTPEGGRVLIRATRISAHYEVMVQDSGMGIAPEHHAKIFEKFGQVDTTETREIKGSGLGLPIARSIVMAHKGTLTVESERGQGSKFFVRLPLPIEETAASEEDRPHQPHHVRLGDLEEGIQTVLVVDDEVNIRRFLRHLLEQEGFAVIEAANGQEAVEMAILHKPRVVLLDLMLPDVNGFEVLTRIKSNPDTSDVPVIILSIIQDLDKGYRLGASDFLTKPIDREKLLDRISRYVGSRTSDLLVVEDDDSVMRAVKHMLEHHGYRVRTCPDGESALAEVGQRIPDLILLDLMLPGLTGHDVLYELRRKADTAHVPVIVLTAAGPDERTRALGMGANQVVPKPFTETELATLVRNLLAEATA